MQPWQPLLNWWFASDELPASARADEISAARHTLWFGKRDEQDALVRQRFAREVTQALAGQLQWADNARGWLANLIVLDQFPRMMFRDTAQAFAGDKQAQVLLTSGLSQGFDLQLSPIERVFAYLIYEHAEDVALQARSVALFGQLHDQVPADEQPLFAGFLDFALRHQRVIERFGRFVHRNEVLGRSSSDAELAFLRQPGSRF